MRNNLKDLLKNICVQYSNYLINIYIHSYLRNLNLWILWKFLQISLDYVCLKCEHIMSIQSCKLVVVWPLELKSLSSRIWNINKFYKGESLSTLMSDFSIILIIYLLSYCNDKKTLRLSKSCKSSSMQFYAHNFF